jgi:hypothetical protein
MSAIYNPEHGLSPQAAYSFGPEGNISTASLASFDWCGFRGSGADPVNADSGSLWLENFKK